MLLKKLLTITIICTYIVSFIHISYANQISLFQNTYSRLVSQLLSEDLVVSDTIANNNSLKINISNTESENNMSIKWNIIYNHITQTKINWIYQEWTLNFNLTISIDVLELDNIILQGSMEFKATPVHAFIKINNINTYTHTDASDIQTEILVFFTEQIKSLQWQRIHFKIPDEYHDSIKTSASISPAQLMSTLQTYPIIENAWYHNNIFTIKLHTDNIITLLKTHNIINLEEEYNTMKESRTYEEYHNDMMSRYDHILSETEFKNLWYEQYIDLLKEHHSYNTYITKKQYRHLKKLYNTNEQEFIRQMEDFIFTHTSYTIEDIEEMKERIREYPGIDTEWVRIEEDVNSNNSLSLSTAQLEHNITLETYSSILWRFDLLPSIVDFDAMHYDDFLLSIYDIKSKDAFLADQQEWNNHVEEEYHPEILQKEFADFLKSLNIQWSLSTDDVPSLTMYISPSENMPFEGKLLINQNTIALSGSSQEKYDYEDGDYEDVQMTLSASIHSTDNTHLTYNIDTTIKQTSSWYNPSQFLLSVSGETSYTIPHNYRFKRPDQAKSMDEIISTYE